MRGGVVLQRMTNFVSGRFHSYSQRNKKTHGKTKSTIFMAFFVIGEEISLRRNNTNPHTREGGSKCWPVIEIFFQYPVGRLFIKFNF